MLKGKIALVTGSTSGIGLGIAKALAAQGAQVMLNGFGEFEAAKAEVAALATGGARVAYHGADMTQARADIEAMMKACEAELGPVDILVNNAGIQVCGATLMTNSRSSPLGRHHRHQPELGLPHHPCWRCPG